MVVDCHSMCRAIPLTIQGQVDLYILPISGAEVVLGVQWLKQLDLVLMDYNTLTMKFIHNGSPIEFKAHNPSIPLDISAN